MKDMYDLRDLGGELEDLVARVADPDDGLDEDEAKDLKDLQELAAQLTTSDLKQYANDYSPMLIADSYFVDYARELAEDMGVIPDDARWPANCIDWEQAARELKMDYTVVTYAGSDYYIQS